MILMLAQCPMAQFNWLDARDNMFFSFVDCILFVENKRKNSSRKICWTWMVSRNHCFAYYSKFTHRPKKHTFVCRFIHRIVLATRIQLPFILHSVVFVTRILLTQLYFSKPFIRTRFFFVWQNHIHGSMFLREFHYYTFVPKFVQIFTIFRLKLNSKVDLARNALIIVIWGSTGGEWRRTKSKIKSFSEYLYQFIM